MRFRPCIDIHNGAVKQIVGGSLREGDAETSSAQTNFVSELDGGYYGELYKSRGLRGGHIILLNSKDSPYYEQDVRQAELALKAYEGGLQVGGGIDDRNAGRFLDMGASHVIVTSFVFRGGKADLEALEKMKRAVGKERLVLDLSCRKRDGKYHIVTDRWQKFTDTVLSLDTLKRFREHCSELLVHAVDVEGKARGIEKPVASLLGECEDIVSTYAGGIGSFQDLDKLRELGRGRVDFTIGSALDIFGGTMPFDEVCGYPGEVR